MTRLARLRWFPIWFPVALGLSATACGPAAIAVGVASSGGGGGGERIVLLAPEEFAPPSNLRAVPTGTATIALSWQDNTADETGFRIRRRTEAGLVVELPDLPPDTTAFVDAPPIGRFAYSVQAVRLRSLSIPSESALASPLAATTLLHPLTGESVTPDSLLSWSTASAIAGAVAIELSADSGASYALLDPAAPDDDSEPWSDLLPAIPGDGLRFRLRLTPTDLAGYPGVAGVSTGDFEIYTEPTLFAVDFAAETAGQMPTQLLDDDPATVFTPFPRVTEVLGTPVVVAAAGDLVQALELTGGNGVRFALRNEGPFAVHRSASYRLHCRLRIESWSAPQGATLVQIAGIDGSGGQAFALELQRNANKCRFRLNGSGVAGDINAGTTIDLTLTLTPGATVALQFVTPTSSSEKEQSLPAGDLAEIEFACPDTPGVTVLAYLDDVTIVGDAP